MGNDNKGHRFKSQITLWDLGMERDKPKGSGMIEEEGNEGGTT